MLSSAGLASLWFANQVRFQISLQTGVLFQEADVEISHFSKKYLQLFYGWQDCHSETKTNRPNFKKSAMGYHLIANKMNLFDRKVYLK